MTWVGVGAELLGDWWSATGQAHMKLMADHLPFSWNNYVGLVCQGRFACQPTSSGTRIPGAAQNPEFRA